MTDNHDPICEGDAIWQSRTKPCPVCALIAKARADERRDIAIQARDARGVVVNDDDGRRRMIESLALASVIVAGIFILIYWIEWTG